MKAIVEPSGQLILPKIMLEQLGIQPGTVMDVQVDTDSIVAGRESREEAIRSRYGSVQLGMSTDEFLSKLRDAE